MMRPPHRVTLSRRTLLFLSSTVALFVSLLIVGIGAARQEDELAQRRTTEQNRLAVALARHELEVKLDNLLVRAAAGRIRASDSEVVLTARMDNGRARMPWEGHQRDSNLDRELLRAAALRRSGREADARAIWRTLLNAPLADADEYGIPMAVYAAKALARGASSQDSQAIITRLETMLSSSWISPAATYMIADVLSMTGGLGKNISDATRIRARELEQAADIASALDPLPPGDIAPPWHLQGTPPLLAGVSDCCVVVARPGKVLESIHIPDGARWIIGRGERAEIIGDSFPGLRLAFAAQAVSPGRQWLYWSALALLASVMAFSGYLWNRDVRREARTAEIRAGFVSSVSHELRTPIASIRACAEMIQMGRVQSEGGLSDYIKTIVGESERLSRLVEGVLEFSRIEQGKRIYHFENVDLQEAIRAAVAAMDYSLQQGGFSVRIEAERIPPARAEREAIEQVIVNLLSNAIKYSGDSREIHVELRRQEDRAVVRIRDFGLGIPAEEQSRIFDRFYRTRQPRERNIPGTGLGLALVEQIVKAHGGEVAVNSRPGEGSAFSISLPLAVKA